MTQNKEMIETTSGKPSKAERRRLTVDVYDAEYTCVFLGVPRDRTSHIPHRTKAEHSKPLLQCKAHRDTGSCSAGPTCPFVHVDLTDLIPQPIHVNYAYKSLDDIKYRRLAPNTDASVTSDVLAPNNRTPLSAVTHAAILWTRGSATMDDHETPLSQCAHFYFNRMCNRGERCLYLHVAHVDADVTDGELAPPPQAIGPNDAHVPSTPISCKAVTQQVSPSMSALPSALGSPCMQFSPMFRPTKASDTVGSYPSQSGLSLPSAMDSQPTSATYTDADIDAILNANDDDSDGVATQPSSPSTSLASSQRRTSTFLECIDRERGRVLYLERETRTPSQFRYNPYSC